MRKKSFLSLCLTFLLLGLSTACKQEQEPTTQNSFENTVVTQTQDVLYTDAELSRQAIGAYKALFSGELRAYTKMPAVKNILRHDKARTATQAEQASGVVVVNFEDNKGYIVMSESRHGEPILFACPKGYLDPNNPDFNPNQLTLIHNLSLLSDRGHEGNLNSKLDTMHSTIADDTPDNRIEFDYGEWEAVEHIFPLLRTEWNQWHPFNARLKPIRDTVPPVGCVATAVAQIMAYHKDPAYDWDQIPDDYKLMQGYAIDAMAELHRQLGLPHNLDMQYSPQKSGALDTNVPRTFRNFGYQCNELYDYSWEALAKEIREKRPVYVRASSIKVEHRTPKFLFWGGEWVFSHYEGGHAWVLDGIIILKRNVRMREGGTGRVIKEYDETKRLVHCNFGWGPPFSHYGNIIAYNGYYVDKAFNPLKGPELRSLMTGDNRHSGEMHNYQYYHQIITGIKR